MAKFIIKYNAGYGDMYEEIEADNKEEANEVAYQTWRDAAESQADFEAMEWTEELAEDYL